MYTSSMAISEYPVSLAIFPIIESCEKYVKKIRLGFLGTKLNYDFEGTEIENDSPSAI